ncbi:hypothetical protein JAU75_00520 [Ochrobactrum sp. Q0168]|uniref:hypothetical protein n=1 Tax=Ochrobactrum sp. Q0168 TaxID=2793241 RepID=UPI0018ED6777|nr:hypothetical protein [Ochrobactrum sp. Q0168]
MTVQCQTVGQTIGQTAARNRGSARPESHSIFRWLRQALAEIRSQIDQWLLDRKIARTRLAVQNLPEHIRQDVGWPTIEDRLPVSRQGRPTHLSDPR